MSWSDYFMGLAWRGVNVDVYETQRLAQVSLGKGFVMGWGVGLSGVVLTSCNVRV
jgi:hypothetical protein